MPLYEREKERDRQTNRLTNRPTKRKRETQTGRTTVGKRDELRQG